MQQTIENNQNHDSLLRLTHVIYAIQAACFIFGITYFIAIIAVIINHIKINDVRGSWLESHFIWQIRTFWFGLLWFVLGAITVFIVVGFIIWIVAYIWVIYRVIKGWLYLNDKRIIG